MKYKDLINSYIDGNLTKGQLFRVLLKKMNEDFLKNELVDYYELEHYPILEEFFKSFFEAYKFSFPVVSSKGCFENFGLVIHLPFDVDLKSNNKNVEDKLKSLISSKNTFVLFKDNNFKGNSFSLAFFSAFKLKKDIEDMMISADVQGQNIYAVDKEREKYLLAKSIKKPILLSYHAEKLDAALSLINKLLELVNIAKSYKPKAFEEFDINQKYFVLLDLTYDKKSFVFGLLKYIYESGDLGIYINPKLDNIEAFKNVKVFKIIDIIASDVDINVDIKDFNMIISYEPLKDVEEYCLLELKDKTEQHIYEYIDNSIRAQLKEANMKNPSKFINNIIKLNYLYKGAIPLERLDQDDDISKIPFLLEKDLKLYINNSLYDAYLLSRYFVEQEAIEDINMLVKVIAIFHPEFELLDKNVKIKLLKDVYNSGYFRRFNQKEKDIFLKLLEKNKLECILMYERARKFYQESKYEEVIHFIKDLDCEELKVLRINTLIDLWAIEGLEKDIQDLNISKEKRLGILGRYYMKMRDYEKACYYFKEKYETYEDFRNASDYIMSLSYLYRITNQNHFKSQILEIFDKAYKNYKKFEKLKKAKYDDLLFLLRNLSYTLTEDILEYLEAYVKNINLEYTEGPSYPLLINYFYLKKDHLSLKKLADEKYIEKEPLENAIASLALFLTTKNNNYKENFCKKYRYVKDRFDAILKSLGTHTLLPEIPEPKSEEDLKKFFLGFPYIQ